MPEEPAMIHSLSIFHRTFSECQHGPSEVRPRRGATVNRAISFQTEETHGEAFEAATGFLLWQGRAQERTQHKAHQGPISTGDGGYQYCQLQGGEFLKI